MHASERERERERERRRRRRRKHTSSLISIRLKYHSGPKESLEVEHRVSVTIIESLLGFRKGKTLIHDWNENVLTFHLTLNGYDSFLLVFYSYGQNVSHFVKTAASGLCFQMNSLVTAKWPQFVTHVTAIIIITIINVYLMRRIPL